MGFFSFITNDSKRSVIIGQKVNIYLIDNRGNVYTEEQYDGYGKFGGKDIFILFAEMNNITLPFSKKDETEKNEDNETGDNNDNETEQLRSYAINKWYHSNDEYIYPNVVENYKSKWVNKIPKDCPDQGAWP
jgi:hypothetical protein